VNGPASIAPELRGNLPSEARRRADGPEPAHDFFHVERVTAGAVRIARAEGAREDVCATAALLHELFSYPKGDPRSPESGDVCAEHARALLVESAAPRALLEPVCEAIRDHAFSKGVVPQGLEARILQDADRLDALGAIGLARMWATCADMKRPLYAPDDPFCDAREPDDKAWGLDHVYKKLFQLPERLHTKTARALAERRVAFMRAYVGELRAEIAEPDAR
jgi:uncharacterized protein